MRRASLSRQIALVPALLAGAGLVAGERLALHHVSLDLPGPPAKVIPLDLDRDGREDLVVVVAYTEIEEIGGVRVENLIQVATVIPALFDRREIRAYLATADGGYRPAGPPLPLPVDVLHLEPGPPGLPLVALTDRGLSELRFTADAGGPPFRFVPLIEDPTVLARTRSFYASLELVRELNGDGIADFLLPASGGLAVHLGTGTGLRIEPSYRFTPASPEEPALVRWYPLPEVLEIDGDGIPDLVFGKLRPEDSGIHVWLGSAAGEFRPLRAEAVDCRDDRTVVRTAPGDDGGAGSPSAWLAFRDLDGDGKAEAIESEERPRGESWRSEMKDAKRPIQTYRFHRLRDDLFLEPRPYFETRIAGHAFETDDERLPTIRHLDDLDGDGRLDLVTVTLDFSVFQVLKILATKKIGIRLDFHVYAQQEDGRFLEVEGLDLSEKLVFDLDNLKLGRFAQFAGDFDGDGRQDFVHLGRGRDVTVHTGQPGCRYPKKPDLELRLDEAPASLDLVRIEDLDGDGRADIRITRPLPRTDVDTSPPVRLDLYLGGGGS